MSNTNEDPWKTIIEDLVSKIPLKHIGGGVAGKRVASRVIWEHLGIATEHRDCGRWCVYNEHNSSDMARIGIIMRRMGFVRKVVRVGKTTVRGWEQPSSSMIWDVKKDEQH